MRRSRILKITLLCLVLAIDAILINFNLRNKFKDVTIELGEESVSINNFLVSKMYAKNSKCLTNLNSIDLSEVGEYDIEFSYTNSHETVKLKIVDTTSPTVEFTDLEKGLDYKFDANDFVTLVHDKSDYSITSESDTNNLIIGDNLVDIAVTDDYGNKTLKQCKLTIGVFKGEINHELGSTLTSSEFLVTDGYGNESITNELLSSIDNNKEGNYQVTLKYEDKEYTTNVIVKDTKGPDIVVNNINFYIGGTPKTNEAFVKSIKDASGVKEITYEGVLDYTKIGTYELKIKAIDMLGNESVAVATLNVRDDNIGPVISGLSTIYAVKNQEIDYYKGVASKDAKDGVREFSIDTSGVNIASAGTYYAVYSSSDTSNNVTTKKRKIVVSYDMSDMDTLAREYFNKYLAGKSVYQMTDYIKKHTGYSHTAGTDADALYQILTKRSGSCRGHAFLLQKALDFAGYKNMIIKTLDGTHYWNLVYENGVWRHYDSTPGSHSTGPLTDDQKYNSVGLHKRNWDRSVYPKAE